MSLLGLLLAGSMKDRFSGQLSLPLGRGDGQEEDWDFADADTKTHTHGYHVYPAMMIPQVARRLIRSYGEGGQLLLDPFCGSGTSLVEARLAGLDAVGIDLNPFAVLLARAKTTDYNLSTLLRQARQLRHFVSDLVRGGVEVPSPSFYNIDYWFKPEVQRDLALLRHGIERVVEPAERDFFWVAFAAAVREGSNTRRGEYKLHRMPESALHTHKPQVFATFWDRIDRNLRGLQEFLRERKPHTRAEVHERDGRAGIPLPANSVDIVVTSPPYGDSQTTVAYGQFSRLVLQWLGYEDSIAKSVDKRALGGKITRTSTSYPAPSLEKALEVISRISPKRAFQVKQFYDDFADAFSEITRVVKPGAYGCFVVGNRTVKGVQLPTDSILIEIAAHLGWTHLTTHHRKIPNKRMPLRNSPSNRPGDISPTMTEEHIVVLQKQG